AGGPVSLVIAGSMGRGTEFNTNDIFITGTNSHTGGTWVNSGRITLNNATANGTTITAIPGNLILAGGYGANNGDFAQRNTAVTLAAPSQIANTATVTVRGGATLDLAGFNQTLGGLAFENTGGTNPTVTTGTGILTLAGNISATGNNVGSVSTIATTGLGEVSLGGATRTITVAPVEWQGRNLNPLHPNLNISGVVTGTGAEGIIKTGTGILQLSGQSTFSGGVALNTGGLMVGGSSTPSAPGSTVVSGPLGTGTLNIAANTFLTSSAAGNAVANNYTIGGDFSFTGINSLFLNGTTTLPSGATIITVQDPTSTPSASALILGGVISGTDNTSSIIKAGLGTLALNNNNTFLGGVTLNAGNLVLGGAPLSNNASPSPTVLVNSADAVLSLMNNGAGSGGVISYTSVIDIANTLPSANLHVGNFSANTANVIEVGNLNLTNTTTLNVSSANLYALRLLNLNTTGGPANINVAAGTTVLVFNYGLNQPVNVGPGQLLFPDQPLINKLDNVATGGSPIALSGTYPLVPKFNALGTTAPTGFNPGGLSASHYSFGSALNTISVGTSGVAPTAQRASTALLGNATYADRPNGVSPANNVNSSSVYSGLLEITTGGTYTFKTAVDDQSLLIIDGITVSGVNAAGGGTGFGDNSATSAGTGSITLAAGFHTITYKNTNSASGGGFHLLYSGADTAGNGLTNGFQAIPGSKLYFNNSPATLANGYQLAAGLTNDYTVGFGTIATIDTFGTQFNLTLNSLDLGPLSTLNVVNGAGSLGTNFVGVSGSTTISGSGAIINTGGTATSGAGILNLIGAVSDSGNGVSKFGAGALILGANNTATFTGAFDVKAGTVQLTHAQALSAGVNTIGSEIVVRANSTTATGSNIVTVSSSAGLSVGQIVNGAGIVPGTYITAIDTPTPNTITLSIPATATGTNNVQINIGGASLDINGLTNVLGNITIAGQGQNAMIANAAAPAVSAFTGALWNSSLTPASLDATSALTIGSPNTVIGGYGDITLNGAITATATNSIFFTGAGTNMMTVDNSTTLLSAITATSGTILKVGHASGLGDTLAGTTINGGAILDLNGITIAENIILNGAGRTNFGAPVNSLGSLINTSNTAASITGTLTLGAAASVGSNRINATSGVATAGDITLDGVVSGAFLLTKVGSNSLTLTKANTQNGLTINQGTVTVNGVAGAA
ncbi:MAG: autotransporter-associated beta strand repeat-containing protein, partial [Verrucomicrobiaceae bacterium]|nr:autotransporter-associated beta strand repeat-containing protein [Verrucomicrobiaceae bacterium]